MTTKIENLIKENIANQNDSYVIANRGFITASKLKDYMNSPEYFYLKYLIEEQPDEKDEKKCFKIGSAVDDFISYWENYLREKYFIDEGLLKPQLLAKCKEKMIAVNSKDTVDYLKQKLYWDVTGKPKLTPAEYKTVINCVKEFNRQPLFDVDGDYEMQKVFIADYKGFKLKGTLDRFKEIEINEKEKIVKLHIRDTKTTADIIKSKFQAIDLGYDFSMSYYYTLVLLEYSKLYPGYKIDIRLTLDIIQTSGNHPYWCVDIPVELVDKKYNWEIKQALNTLVASLKAWNTNKDESIWLIRVPLENTKGLDLYNKMKTTLQQTPDQLS